MERRKEVQKNELTTDKSVTRQTGKECWSCLEVRVGAVQCGAESGVG